MAFRPGFQTTKEVLMNGSPSFSVIIPVYNKWELTENCLRGLHEHTRECAYEVIVVDNGSSDETTDALAPLGGALFGNAFRRIRFEENKNFAPACNAGAGIAAAPLLFFLNNDTLCDPGWAPPLLDGLAADPALGGIGPLLLYENLSVQHLGIVFSPQGHTRHLYSNFPSEHPVVEKRHRFQAITAAALLTPRELFLAHGGFHEEYRNGFEDVDLCLRMGRGGKYFTCCPSSRIIHLESRTPGRKTHEDSNSRLCAKRCQGLWRPDIHLHGLRDGFDAFIADDLSVGLRLKQADEDALNAACRDQPQDVRFRYCRAHPYWISGRRALAAELEYAGRVAEATMLYAEIFDILHSAENAQPLMRVATKLGDADLLAVIKERLPFCERGRRDRAGCRALLRMAEERGDRPLAALYETKLRNMPR
jgi:GT2 family glycosyltransferase